MNYLELVQRTVEESGAKLAIPTTTVGAENLAARFNRWVTSAWKKIQLERLGWHFRVSPGLTMSLVAGTAEYSLPTTLEAVNTRTLVTLNDSEGITRGPVHFRPSDVYRSQVLAVSNRAPGRPTYFTLLPSNELAFWPTPDIAYTLEYEGQLRIQTLAADGDVPQNLHEDYHEAIVWQAVMKYAMAYEDGAKLQEAQAEFMPYKKYFEERWSDIPVVDATALYTSVYPYEN